MPPVKQNNPDSSIKPQATVVDPVAHEMEYKKWLEEWMHLFRLRELGHKASIDYALFGLKTLVLIHGGALITLITFLQTIWKEKAAYTEKTAQALAMFSGGILTALFAILFGYLAMSVFAGILDTNQNESKKYAVWYGRLRKTAIGIVLVSIALFAWGVFTVYKMLAV